jgi:hypothetical protein
MDIRNDSYTATPVTSTGVKAGLIAGIVLALAALAWCFGLQNHLEAANKQVAAAAETNRQMQEKQDALSARLRATSETLGQSIGVTQKQIEQRTQSLIAAQSAQAASVRAQGAQTAKLAEEQAATAQKVGTVATNVTALNTDVTGAKASIADTQNDLASTKQQLQRTMGDQGVMSGLIARTHNELEVLKHKGDRNYFEFTLQKGAKPTLLASIKLQVKKVDDKHSKYTMIVSSDDRNIEKKDKSLDEPVQFYSGKDPALFELVVNNISKNQVSGYLSTPKGAPGTSAP